MDLSTKASYHTSASFLAFALLLFFPLSGYTQQFQEDTLPKGITEEEMTRLHEIGLNFTPTPPPSGDIRNIAEFERNEGVLIRWPLWVPLDLVASISEHAVVTTIVSGNAQRNQAITAYENAGVTMENTEFLIAPSNSVWTRDYGPFYIANEDHQVSIVDFVYNRPRPFDDQIPQALGNMLDIPVYGMNIVHTGGNYMTDGWRTSASTDLIWEENNFNESLVLTNMNDYLNTETYHVTIDPQDSAIKHIDTWSKFLDVDKILIARVPQSHARYAEHEEVAEYFAGQISPWGTPYQVYRVDTPQGQPYTNSLIVNERVYVPLMNSAHDAAAIAAYEEAMPGYEILGFTNPGATGWNPSDALHCRVKEIPDRGMLSMLHKPLVGAQPYQNVYELDVDIVSYSGASLIEESLVIHYRLDEQPWQTSSLSQTDQHTWTGSIPAEEETQTISYYFAAADDSGREETWPLIGEPGSRTFEVDSSTETLVVTYPAGWSLAGIPAETDATFEELFPDSGGPLPLALNPQSGEYVSIETFTPGQGFWLYLDEETELMFDAGLVESLTFELGENINEEDPFQLITGPAALIPFPATGGLQQRYGYGDTFFYEENFTPGRAYFATGLGTLELHPDAPAGAPRADAAPASSDSTPHYLEFASGDGNITLSFNWDNDEFMPPGPYGLNLPPLPPDEVAIFDARFINEQGGYRRSVLSNTAEVHIRHASDFEGGSVPVTLTPYLPDSDEIFLYTVDFYTDGQLSYTNEVRGGDSITVEPTVDFLEITFDDEPVSTAPPIDELPESVTLSQNYPNPFNPTTVINYELPSADQVRLEVYNIQGQRVSTLVNGTQAAGSHSITFDASQLSSGVYVYRLQSGGTSISKSMMLVK